MIGKGLITRGNGGLVFTNDGTITTLLGIEGDYLRIGDATATSRSLSTNDQLLVTGKLEVDGALYMDNNAYLNAATSDRAYLWLQENQVSQGAFVLDGNYNHIAISFSASFGRQLILTTNTNHILNHDHGTQTNPTLFIQSATSPDSENDEWISFTHDVTDGVIAIGSGSLILPAVKKLKYGAEVDLTINSGVVAVTQTYHSIIVQGGAGNGNDQLDTATGGSEGDILILKPNTSGGSDTITVADSTGSDTFILAGGANFAMDHIDDRLTCIHNGTEWVEISRSSNS